MRATKYIAVFNPGPGFKGEPRPDRYVDQPGSRAWRGMYKNRRRDPSRDIKPTLTDDRERAFLFNTRKEVFERLRKFWGDRAARDVRVESVRVERDDPYAAWREVKKEESA